MKRISLLIFSGILLFCLFACFDNNKYVDDIHEISGIDISDCTVVTDEDSHGGFHGDGMRYVHIDCSGYKETVEAQISSWNKFPLSANLNIMLYGGEKNGITYSWHLAEDCGIPIPADGAYYFIDRHYESSDPHDDTNVLARGSFNFSLLIYDYEDSMLYLVEYDT
ncbi:MAG: hypothetical protein E7218_07655 [Anaerofustis stercorihominis]|nr:hypothetical protein [Anaerofustis stercorihominis]